MAQKHQIGALLLIFITAASFFPVRLANGALKMPSTPEYTVHYINEPNHRAIEIIVRNQLFTPYKDKDGNTVDLCYFARYKGHFASWGKDGLNESSGGASVEAYNSSYTVLSFAVEGFGWNPDSLGFVDIQVKAFLGYSKTMYQFDGHILPLSQYTIYVSYGESSWGNTQTVYMGADGFRLGPFDDVPVIFCSGIVAFACMITVIIVMVRLERRRSGQQVKR
ncbi:MAG: hypothetical protein ACQCN6_08560 [Candidatus Bathyarchaeia archaeon]|jgi:hypothetical protein